MTLTDKKMPTLAGGHPAELLHQHYITEKCTTQQLRAQCSSSAAVATAAHTGGWYMCCVAEAGRRGGIT